MPPEDRTVALTGLRDWARRMREVLGGSLHPEVVQAARVVLAGRGPDARDAELLALLPAAEAQAWVAPALAEHPALVLQLGPEPWGRLLSGAVATTLAARFRSRAALDDAGRALLRAAATRLDPRRPVEPRQRRPDPPRHVRRSCVS